MLYIRLFFEHSVMDIQDILKSTSFSALDESGQQLIREHIAQYFLHNEGAVVAIPLVHILKQQQSLLVILRMQEQMLAQTNEASFPYLSLVQKQLMEERLLFTFFVFSAQLQLKKAQGHGVDHEATQMKKCANLLQELRRNADLNQIKTPQMMLDDQLYDSEKHLKYIGLTVVSPFIMQHVDEFLKTREKNIDFLLNDLNNKRRYWIWAGGLLSQIFETLSNRFYQTENAQEIFASNEDTMSYIGWIVLYARWGTHLGTFFRHTIVGVSQEEKSIPMQDRLLSEWQQRKYVLMQDTLSISVGLMCSFWAIAGSPFAQLAAPLPAILRLLSLVVVLKQYAEQSLEHEDQILCFNNDIRVLEDKLSAIGEQQSTVNIAIDSIQANKHGQNPPLLSIEQRARKILTAHNLQKLQQELEQLKFKQLVLEQELEQLYKNKQKYKTQWHAKANTIHLEIGLASGLLTGATLMACAFFPPIALMPIVATILNLTGISICFSATVVHCGLKGQSNIAQSQQQNKSITEECALLLLQFNLCEREEEKKSLYLQMKSLQAQSDYQQQLVIYQQMKLIHTVLIQALLPALIFTTFVFMPAAGIALLGVSLLLAFAADQYLNQYKPKELILPELDEGDYQAFLANPTLALLKTQAGVQTSNSAQARKDQNNVEGDDVEYLNHPLHFE